MKTVACYKATFDNQDIEVKPDLSVGFDRAATVIGEYDLVAIEEAVRLAEATEGECVLLTAGDAKLNDTKLTKAALSRGAKELFRVEDAALTGADSSQAQAPLPARCARWSSMWFCAARARAISTRSRWEPWWVRCSTCLW